LVVVPVAGVGDNKRRRGGGAGRGELALGGADRRLEVAGVGGVGVELRGNDDLVLVADGLRVVALQVAARGLDVARVGSVVLTLPAGVAGAT
jgi:hypothetical protein